jgi:type II secretory pathway pseudopilin PulG
MTHLTSKNGFTIVEVVAYVAVLGIVGTSFSAVFLWGIKTHTKSQVMQETTWNAKRAMDVIVQEIREAESIYSPTTAAPQLSLETTKYTAPGHLTSFIDFFLCEEKLCFKRESGDPAVLTSDNVRVTLLSFQEVQSSLASQSLRVTLRVEYKNPNNRPELISSLELSSVASVR